MRHSGGSAPVYPDLFLVVDGERLGADQRSSISVLNPATGTELARLPVATPADIERAVAAANRAFPIWNGYTAVQRYEILAQAANLMRQRARRIGEVLTLEQGKNLAESTREVTLSADIIL